MAADSSDDRRDWNVVRLDAEASRWRQIARHAFVLRFPAALDKKRPFDPPDMAHEIAEFRRYGAELNVLEHDLAECLNEFKQAYQVLYRDPDLIAQKKFSVVYHTDNFLIRLHKFRENVYRLLALTVGLDHSGTPSRSGGSREAQVANALERCRLGSIGKCVRQFDRNGGVTAAIKERNLFVHQFRDDPRRPELGAESRARDFEDRVAADVSAMTDLPAIDGYADRKADELLRIPETIRDFRNRLYEVTEAEIIVLIGTRSPETRRRLQRFVDATNLLRGLAD